MPSTKLLRVTLRFLLFFFLFTESVSGLTQTCIPNFQKTYGGNGSDEGLDVIYTNDRGSIVAGRTTSGRTDMNGVLMKLNDQGSIQWTKSYGQSSYDELSKVKQTTDGGFVAVGRTAESVSSQGDAWIIRTDNNGNTLWSRKLPSSLGATTSKDIIQTDDGGFAVALNANDSTTQSDGILVRLDRDGSIIWSRSYDNGNNDGFYTVTQDRINLVAAGFTTKSIRTGIALKVSLNDGSLIWTKNFLQPSDLKSEVIRVDVIPNGYMFAVKGQGLGQDNIFANSLLFLVKMQNDVITVHKNVYSIQSESPYTVGNVGLKFAGDSSFVFIVSDTSTPRRSVYRKIVMRGLTTGFSGRPDGYHQVNSLEGIDPYEDKGLMLAGTRKEWFANSKIQVIKTDWEGKFGSCTGNAFGSSATTTPTISVNPFDWSNTSTAAVSAIPVVAGDAPITFVEQVLCQKQDCIPAPAINDNGCYATFLTEYWNKYQLVPFEAVKVPDGYILAGYNRRTIQPIVIKILFNGILAWSKTLGSEFHDASFQHVRLMEDGNVLLVGPGGYTINHGGNSITVFVKIDPAGHVLWSKYVAGSIADLKTSGNGTFTGLLHYNMEQEPVTVLKFTINAAGTLTYKKRLSNRYEMIPTFRRMVLDGNDMYAAGGFNNSLFIEKFDSSGTRIWTKRFRPEGKFGRVDGLYMKGDSIYLMARTQTAVGWTSKENLVLVKVGKDGNGLNGVMIQQDLALENSFYFFWLQTQIFHTAMTRDGNFVLADRIPGLPDSALVVIKFTPTGQLLWAKKFPGWKRHKTVSVQDDGSGLLIVGHRIFQDNDYSSFFINPLLIRTNDNGELLLGSSTDACGVLDFTTTTRAVNLEQEFPYNSTTSSFQDLDIDEKWYELIDCPLETVPNFACGIKGDCSTIDLTGPSTMCFSTDAVTYEAQKNPGCTLPIAWSFDSIFVQVTASTESSRSFMFKRAGTTKIYASVQTTCGSYVDSLEVKILPSAGILDLGSDTTICPGNTIILRTPKDFASYSWQDGSTHATYAVTEPGNYSVTVTDACGEIHTDNIQVLSHPPIPFTVSSDRTKCNNDTVQFNAPSGFLNYSWTPVYNISSQTGQRIVVNPSIDTTYYVKAEKTPGCFAYDTIRVRVHTSPAIQLGSDLSFCSGDSAKLDAGAGFSSYLWSTGESTQQAVVRAAGRYSVTATTDKGCKSMDTLIVNNMWPLPLVNLENNSELCSGSTKTLIAGNYSTYLWQDGSTSKTYTAKGLGRYYVRVTDLHGCVGSDTTEIKTMLPLPTAFLPPDTMICSYGQALIKPRQNYTSYLWSDGSRSSSIMVEKPGLYWLQVEDNKHCIGRDSLVVGQKDCMSGVYIPNAFTPNNDGRNDLFKAMVFGKVKKFELTVYNRWGEVIFQTTEPSRGWNGKVANIEQVTSVFVWVCRYQMEGEKEVIEKGTVSLLQ